MFDGRRPDGIILTGSLLDGAARKQLKSTGITIIETWDLPASPIDLVVGVSHEAIGKAVARHALALVRRHALVIVGGRQQNNNKGDELMNTRACRRVSMPTGTVQ